MSQILVYILHILGGFFAHSWVFFVFFLAFFNCIFLSYIMLEFTYSCTHLIGIYWLAISGRLGQFKAYSVVIREIKDSVGTWNHGALPARPGELNTKTLEKVTFKLSPEGWVLGWAEDVWRPESGSTSDTFPISNAESPLAGYLLQSLIRFGFNCPEVRLGADVFKVVQVILTCTQT